MDIKLLGKRYRQVLNQHSPEILMAIGVSGTLTTAILSVRSTFRLVSDLVDDDEYQYFLEAYRMEKAKIAWKYYIPPAISTIATISAVMASSRVSSTRTGAAIAAYSLSETAFREYREKVVETIGQRKDQKIHDAVMEARVKSDPVSTREVIIAGSGEVLCYDALTGRYFNSSMETIRKAQNDINEQIFNDMYASHNDFFSRIGLPTTRYGEEQGWNIDTALRIEFSTVLSDDGRPCLCIDYKLSPSPSFYKVN